MITGKKRVQNLLSVQPKYFSVLIVFITAAILYGTEPADANSPGRDGEDEHNGSPDVQKVEEQRKRNVPSVYSPMTGYVKGIKKEEDLLIVTLGKEDGVKKQTRFSIIHEGSYLAAVDVVRLEETWFLGRFSDVVKTPNSGNHVMRIDPEIAKYLFRPRSSDHKEKKQKEPDLLKRYLLGKYIVQNTKDVRETEKKKSDEVPADGINRLKRSEPHANLLLKLQEKLWNGIKESPPIGSFVRIFSFPEPDPDEREQIRHYIKQLGNKTLRQRKKAQNKLRSMGLKAVPFLGKKLNTSNPEMRHRVTHLLKINLLNFLRNQNIRPSDVLPKSIQSKLQKDQ